MVSVLKDLEQQKHPFEQARPNSPAPPPLLTVAETAMALRLGRTKVYELIATNQLPSLHLGPAVRVPLEALQD